MRKTVLITILASFLFQVPTALYAVTFQELVILLATIAGEGALDGCLENNDGTDADIFAVNCSLGTGQCFAGLLLCDVMEQGAKYRIHFDTQEPFFDDNEDCLTTSDETFMFRPRGQDPANGKMTGPDPADFFSDPDGQIFFWVFDAEELGVEPGDYVAAWLDIHKKGFQDRVPNTDGSDGCPDPQDISEVIETQVVLDP